MRRSILERKGVLVLALAVLAAPALAGKKEDKPAADEEKPFEDVVKGMDVVPGLFTFYRKADQGKLLLELQPEQLGRLFLLATTVDQSVGERGLYAAQMLGELPFYFRRVGKNVQWMQKNVNFRADDGTPAARATERSFADALLGTGAVLSKPHPKRQSLLVDTGDFFLKDLPGFTIWLNQVYQPSSYQFDRDHSAVLGARAFPQNVLVDVWLHYQTDSPKVPSVALADWRSIPIKLTYDLSALPTTDYKPRAADDRVGHFITVQEDFTSAESAEPFRRLVNRWDLRKADSGAPLSPPVKPIVFWLENTIPVEYREAMRDGALLWNAAFERVGFKDAVVVKQQPDDADWDPADTRYNTIRWFAGVDASFAIGPSRAHPLTGEIYDADIGFSDGIVRSLRRIGEELVSPVLPAGEPGAGLMRWAGSPRSSCDYASGLALQAGFAVSVLDSRGGLSPETQARMMREVLVSITAHEVGHTLGLRHNFRASTILSVAELADAKKVDALSQSSSVMDYNPVMIAGEGESQGHFMPVALGPYDYWAIEYAYKPIEGDEGAALATIASRAGADPLLPYSTDEDALGTFSPRAMDPLANQFDASSDPLAYFEKRIGIVGELFRNMETRLARPGEGYQVLRRAMGRGLFEYNRGLLVASKFVGGVYHYRDHVGDPGRRPPFTPVPAAKQREALQFLARNAFSPQVLVIAPSLMNRLAVERQPALDWNAYWNLQRLDYPWHDAVLQVQSSVLGRLLNPLSLGRVLDNELRFGKDETPFRMVELFDGLDRAIWSELDKAKGVSSLRRNLQREHVSQLTRIALRQPVPPPSEGPSLVPPPPVPPYPEDSTTLARASLVRIRGKIRQVLIGALVSDATTIAHLRETEARIDAVLAAQVQRTAG